ncbi:MAG: type II toxin-antitoxin system VapC family toxin [Sedimentisphaerales bacterium]|nr:type II toxin-antitoxin system VapC family toxin [Sedimentisphaerales bacterium]
MRTAYIESTVVSYYVARRTRDLVAAAHQQITSEWWERALPSLEPYVSQIVLDEISRGDADAAQRRSAAVRGFGVLEMTPQVAALADLYFNALAIPDKAKNDSYHLALAAYHGMDYLVSWNCAHITAGRVRAVVEALNDERGYQTPIICTPEELMEV